MAQGHTITVTPSHVHVQVALNGVTVAESDQPVLLEETGLPTRYYLPREDVRTDLVRSTDFHTTCPFKGEASYWTVDVDGETFEGVAWSYEMPLPAVAEIKGLLCFYPERVKMTVGSLT